MHYAHVNPVVKENTIHTCTWFTHFQQLKLVVASRSLAERAIFFRLNGVCDAPDMDRIEPRNPRFRYGPRLESD